MPERKPVRISQIFRFECDEKIAVESAGNGEIIALAVMEDETVGVTFTDPENPSFLPLITIDPPTISINFIPNISSFAGKEGKYVTSRHINDLFFAIIRTIGNHRQICMLLPS